MAQQKPGLKDLQGDAFELPRCLDKSGSSVSADTQLIYGQDSHGNSLLVNVTRQNDRRAQVWLALKLQDGRSFTLPDHPNTEVLSESDESFSAGGLTMDCLVPFMSWRIRFNGLLRQGVRAKWSSDIQDEELVSVNFHFLWSVKSKPIFAPVNYELPLTASSEGECQGYDQYGAMFGEVFIVKEDEEKEQFEINLPGLRKRRWETGSVEKLKSARTIIGVFADGMVFNVTAFIGNGIKNAQIGTVSYPGGRVEFINWTDFKVDSAKSAKIQFKVNKDLFSFQVKGNASLSFFTPRPATWQTDCDEVSIEINGKTGSGIELSSRSSDIDPKIPELPMYRRVAYYDVLPKADKFTYPFEDQEAGSVLISGGKGASLALLTSISQMKSILEDNSASLSPPEFSVPHGFVLSVSAMDAMVSKDSKLNSRLDQLVKICAEGGDFKNQCEVIKKAIEELELSSEVSAAIQTALQEVTGSDEATRIAVRSSSVCEDGEDVSAAGQNDTFLGLRTIEDILVAVKRCWASLYSFQSVHYRKQNIQPIRTGMAVVIQTMLAADCAGVLFSQHPISGDRKKCLVSANYGLGESVVSGEVDPDNYVVQRNYSDNQLRVLQKARGKKGYKIQMSQDDSVEKVQVEGDDFCLTNDIVLKLAEIGIVLEKIYGNGRDIEWGLKDNRIYLLQSRPITSLNQFTDWELIHEFDTAIMSEEDLCTTCTVQEVMPGALCALTRHYQMTSMEEGISQVANFVSNPDPYNRFITVARHHVFMDIYKSFFQGSDPQVTVDMRMNSIIMAGYDFITPEIHKTAMLRAPDASQVASKFKMMLAVAKECWNAKSTADEAMAMAQSFKSTYTPQRLSTFKTAQELFSDISVQYQMLIKIFLKHVAASMAHSFYNRIIMIMLTEGQKEVNDDLLDDYKMISSSAKDTISADIPKKLEAMAKGIFRTGKKEDFGSVDAEKGAEWLKANAPETHQVFQDFIEHNSHRGFQEYDFASTTWGIRPAIIIEMLQSLLKHAENIESLGKTNEITEIEPAELVQQLKSPKKWLTKLILRKAIALSHTAVQYREKTKYSYICVINQFRLAFWHLGKMMASEGSLPSWDLIFQVNNREIQQLLTNRDVNVVKKAMRRQKMIKDLKKERYADIQPGIPVPNNVNKKPLNFEAGTEIKGTSVYGGVVTGRASIIHDFSEVSKIQPGDILITYSTDIGWSPYFPILGGVVTEIGGLISHGAVVAREYGLPCVVAASNAVEFFTDGEIVTLDAARGVIFKGTGN